MKFTTAQQVIIDALGNDEILFNLEQRKRAWLPLVKAGIVREIILTRVPDCNAQGHKRWVEIGYPCCNYLELV